MNIKADKILALVFLIINLLSNAAIADDYDYTQSSYTPPSGNFIIQTFSDSSSSRAPANTFNPANNMNLNNPGIIMSSASLSPGNYAPGNIQYNQSMNAVSPVSSLNSGNSNLLMSGNLAASPALSGNVLQTGTYSSIGLPASYNMPASMNLSNLPNPQSTSLNNYANALNSAINNYNSALSNYVNSYNNVVANLPVRPDVATIYSSVPSNVISGNNTNLLNTAPASSPILYSTSGLNNNNSIPVNYVNTYQPQDNDMQRAKGMYDNIMSDINSNSFVQDAQRYGLSVEKSGGYGLNPMTGSPGAYAQVDVRPYDPVVNAAADAFKSGYKDVAITSEGVLTANPIETNQTRSIIIDNNNPTFIGKDNIYSMYRSTPELAQDLATHDANVAKANNLTTYSPINVGNNLVETPKIPLVQQDNVQSNY